jgi:peptidoglycan/LPS O-acetylase OafA/YrhL
MESPNIKYIPAVDHLRGLAAALIVFYHGLHLISYQIRYAVPIRFDHWPQAGNIFSASLVEGHTAVALFMVLSGFIFAYGAGQRDISYLPFIRNRFLRIYPLFLVLIVAGLAAYPDRFDFSGLMKTIFFQANSRGSLSLGPFSAMFWAIAVEFQFYLIFPFLYKLSRRYGPVFLVVCAAAALFLKILAASEAASIRDLTYLTLLGRIDQFLFGMLLAGLYHRWQNRKRLLSISLPFALAAVMALLYGFHIFLGGWPSENWFKVFWPTLEGLAWAAVILCYLVAAQKLPDRLSGPLARLGVLSYSIYLLHIILITFMVQHGLYARFGLSPEGDALLNTLLFVFPAILVCATVTYQLIEAPFLRLRVRYFVEKQPAH